MTGTMSFNTGQHVPKAKFVPVREPDFRVGLDRLTCFQPRCPGLIFDALNPNPHFDVVEKTCTVCGRVFTFLKNEEEVKDAFRQAISDALGDGIHVPPGEMEFGKDFEGDV